MSPMIQQLKNNFINEIIDNEINKVIFEKKAQSHNLFFNIFANIFLVDVCLQIVTSFITHHDVVMIFEQICSN